MSVYRDRHMDCSTKNFLFKLQLIHQNVKWKPWFGVSKMPRCFHENKQKNGHTLFDLPQMRSRFWKCGSIIFVIAFLTKMFGIDSCLSWHTKCSQRFICPFAQCADKLHHCSLLFFLLFLMSLFMHLSLQDQFLCKCNKIYLNLQLHWPGFVYSNYSIRVSEWCIISGSSHTATWHCSWEVQAHR